jgi:hypothetical protein
MSPVRAHRPDTTYSLRRISMLVIPTGVMIAVVGCVVFLGTWGLVTLDHVLRRHAPMGPARGKFVTLKQATFVFLWLFIG